MLEVGGALRSRLEAKIRGQTTEDRGQKAKHLEIRISQLEIRLSLYALCPMLYAANEVRECTNLGMLKFG